MQLRRTTPKKVQCCNSTEHCPPSHGQPVTPHTFCCARSANAWLWEIWCVLCLCMQQQSSRQVNVGKFFIGIRDNRMTKITARNLLLRSTWNLSSYSKPFFLIGADSFPVVFTLFLLKITRTYVWEKVLTAFWVLEVTVQARFGGPIDRYQESLEASFDAPFIINNTPIERVLIIYLKILGKFLSLKREALHWKDQNVKETSHCAHQTFILLLSSVGFFAYLLRVTPDGDE